MSNVGDGLSEDRGNWKFSGTVVDSFDEHVSKSVPLHHEGHELICDMSDFFIKPDSVCYEIGCSTGTLTLKLADHNRAKSAASFVGIDIEADMIAKAKEKIATQHDLNGTPVLALMPTAGMRISTRRLRASSISSRASNTSIENNWAQAMIALACGMCWSTSSICRASSPKSRACSSRVGYCSSWCPMWKTWLLG